MDWERGFARKDTSDTENASQNCLLLTMPCSSIEVWLNFCKKMSSSEEVMSLTDSESNLKRMRGHLVTLTQSSLHLLTCTSG